MLELIKNVVIRGADPKAITLTEFTDTVEKLSVPVLTPQANVPDKRYAPFRETALFRIFAYTPPSPEGCLRFAQEYGLLGVPYHSHERLLPKLPLGDDPVDLKRAEAISTWVKNIAKLRDLIERWDAVQSQNPAALPKSSPVVEVYPEALPEFLGEKPGDESGMGMWFWDRIAEKDDLAQNRYCVVEDLKIKVHAKFRPRFVWDRSGTQPQPRLLLEPESLWIGLCLQFLLSIIGGTEYGRCRFCERWFELSAEDRRSHKTICSATCRTRLYRNRKRLAYEMSQGGKTAREIARELETDVKTVQGWIQRKGK